MMPLSSFGFLFKIFERLYYARTQEEVHIFNDQPVHSHDDYPQLYKDTVVE